MPDGIGHMQPYLAQALDASPAFAGAGVGWVDALRSEGAERYGDHGLPARCHIRRWPV